MPEAEGLKKQPASPCQLQNQRLNTHKLPKNPVRATSKVPEVKGLENKQQLPKRFTHNREHISPRPQIQDLQPQNQREQINSARPRSRNSGRSRLTIGSAEWLSNRKFQNMQMRKTPDHFYQSDLSSSTQPSSPSPHTPSPFGQSRTYNRGHSHSYSHARRSHRHSQHSESTTPLHQCHRSQTSTRSNSQLFDSRAGSNWVMEQYLADVDLIHLTSGCNLLPPLEQARVHHENVKQQRLWQQSQDDRQQRRYCENSQPDRYHRSKHNRPVPEPEPEPEPRIGPTSEAAEQSLQANASAKRAGQGPVVGIRTEWRL
ncbi:uncharacterized protein K452DRAFT_286565 [Aplosporella prunicola CBS 121167]|uniref:Uncharacterized protein n=1 Tax=Aplosporella prunicola CBS 121167 TaxID=1176127 RepID=A0A6A6BHL1_9PEZI|nr:uncharacterized protein K452DRAFT_286565 [Aplosporella prunicola CBS 121167]KAF2142933.1 hypothetical protein K452DRAFT_286565 [Aplosporella prunicola CBS 121167]